MWTTTGKKWLKLYLGRSYLIGTDHRIENDDGYVNFIMGRTTRLVLLVSNSPEQLSWLTLLLRSIINEEKNKSDSGRRRSSPDREQTSPMGSVVTTIRTRLFSTRHRHMHTSICRVKSVSRLERAERERARGKREVYNIIATIYSLLPSLSSYSPVLCTERKQDAYTHTHTYETQNNIITREEKRERERERRTTMDDDR